MIAVHWTPHHRGSFGPYTDAGVFAEWQPGFVKVVWDGNQLPYLEDIPASAKIIWRNYPLSEEFHGGLDVGTRELGPRVLSSGVQNGSGRDQHTPRQARSADGLATPEQAAAVYVQNAEEVARYCETKGVARSRLLFEGPNEYPVWAQGYAGLARLEAARLSGLHKAGLAGVALNLGVGWPGNTGPDTPPVWEWAQPVLAAFGNGDYLGLHEYWAFAGPQENWGWWAGRLLKCPLRVPILVSECGIDAGVLGPGYAKQGWYDLPGASLDAKAGRYLDELWQYASLLQADGRTRGLLVYTFDGNRADWGRMDIRTETFLRPFLARVRAQGLPQPGTPVVTLPEPEPTPEVEPTPVLAWEPVMRDRRPQEAGNWVSGFLRSPTGAPVNGVRVVFSGAGPDGAWATEPVSSGPHAGYEGWPAGYYSHILCVPTPRQANWWLWLVDAGGQRISEIAAFATDGPGGVGNQLGVDWRARQPITPQPEPAVEVLPSAETATDAATLAEKVRWWFEESVRQRQAGNAARSAAIATDLVRPDGLLYRLEAVLQTGLRILARPLPGGVGSVSQWFGANAAAYAKFGLAGHNGIDYAVKLGTPVLAAHAGAVSVGSDPAGYGNYVKVTGPRYETLYAHLSQVSVTAGERVEVGRQVGLSGNTGNSTGPHLHFGLRIKGMRNPAYGDWIDPVPFRE